MVAAVDDGSSAERSNRKGSNSMYGNGVPGTADPLSPSASSGSDHHHEDCKVEAGVAEEELRSGERDPMRSKKSDMSSNSHDGDGDGDVYKDSSSGGGIESVVVRPPPHLPQPEAPPGVGVSESLLVPATMTKSATANGRVTAEEIGGGDPVMERSVSVGTGRSGGLGNYIRAALARRFAMADDGDSKDEEEEDSKKNKKKKQLQHVEQELGSASPMVTEFHLSGVRVIVRVKDEDGDDAAPGPQIGQADPEAVESTTKQESAPEQLRPQMIIRPSSVSTSSSGGGRIAFFSRSNCRDCGAVRSFFRSRLLAYVEINVDVFPSRLKELVRRTGSGSVPQIFFNGHLVGGLVALNSLRNSGELDRRLAEMMAMAAPGELGEEEGGAPVLGVDDDDEEDWKEDSLAGLARAMRERVAVSDRIARMKLVRGCFSGSELVEAVIEHLDCGRKKAVEMGKELERKHLLHHVFRDQGGFQDGQAPHLYRFLDQDPAVYSCYNMGLGVSYREPRPASWLAQRITKIMQAILEAYASDDRRSLDYNRIGGSEEFRRYVKVAQELQRVDLFALSADERLAFFLNLYNAMVIHAVVCVGRPEGPPGVMPYHSDFHYMVAGYPYSLSAVKNGILRANRRQPYSIARPLAAGDKRLELAPAKVNPLIHFGLCDSTRSSPPVAFFSPQGVEAELRNAAREFLRSGGMEVDLEKRTVYLTRIINWYSADFGQQKQLLNWILPFLDATRAGLLTHLLSDGGPVTVVYQDFDWSLNISTS